MSTCIGTWRDMSVPSDAPGTVLALAHEPRGRFTVMHESTAECPTTEPHDASECGMFEPPRFAPDSDDDGPPYRLRQLLTRDWRAMQQQDETLTLANA